MQPLVWTEDQGWFDQWGVARRVRTSSDQMYGVARFFAYGGTWHNHYMLTGGNNYGLQSGGEVVTSYAPDTVIDSFLLRHQPRFELYSDLYRCLSTVSSALLDTHSVPPASRLASNASNVTVFSNGVLIATLEPCKRVCLLSLCLCLLSLSCF